MTRARAWALAGACLLSVAVAVGTWALPRVSSSDAGEPPAAPPRSGAVTTELRSRPDLRPPEVVVEHGAGDAGGGMVLVTPRAGSVAREVRGHQQGPLIADDQGRIVWFAPPPDGHPATELRVQRYRGEPVLTWWQGAMPSRGSGTGMGMIVDSSYRHVASVRAGNGFDMDLHEFLLTERGTALITIYARARHDLRPAGGAADGRVTQGVLQEIDVATGEVLFEWQSLDHIAPEESYKEAPEAAEDPYDYFHLNSVEEDSEGDLIISARHTSAVYKIDKETGEIAWRLGGKRSDFEMGPGTDFSAQHDARFEGDDHTIRILDNVGREDAATTPSSVKVLALDTAGMRATLVERLVHPDGLWAESQANAHRLEGGGVFVGWGSLGSFTRFGADGRHRFSAHLPDGYDSYRAYLQPWRGMPRTRPRLAATRSGDEVTAYASWNGATQVRRWQVLAGTRRDRLRPTGTAQGWDGLETTLTAPAGGPYVAVRALDARGRTLATSRPVRVR